MFFSGHPWSGVMHNAITDVPGILVGHTTNRDAATGCTVALCEDGAVGGVDVRGSVPGTRETDQLRPGTRSQEVHAVLLSGGSAFGLDAAGGVMRFLDERGIGLQVGPARIPIVPAAILFDLNMITHKVRPGPEDGYQACLKATSGVVEEGSVGAGTGATVGKALGIEKAVKGGVGTASLDLGDGLIVGAIVAVNAVGSVVDPETGKILAGPRDDSGKGMLDTMALMSSPGFVGSVPKGPANTTIGVVATSARLNKEQATKLAVCAHDGLAMAVRPAHTMGDGDCFFALATGKATADVDIRTMTRLGVATSLCVSRAIVRAVQKAKGLGGIPAVGEMK